MKLPEKMYKSFDTLKVEEKLDYLHDALIYLKDKVYNMEKSFLQASENKETRRIDEDPRS